MINEDARVRTRSGAILGLSISFDGRESDKATGLEPRYGTKMNGVKLVKLINILGTWFGCGKSPRAPGTVGTIGALPLVWALSFAGEVPYMAVTFLFAVASILVAQKFEDEFGQGRHDLPEFVMDEVAGFLVTMTLVPFTWQFVLVGFVIFRILDALKPFPISWIDRKVPGGVGVVADDLVAGILANILLHVSLHYHVLPLAWGSSL